MLYEESSEECEVVLIKCIIAHSGGSARHGASSDLKFTDVARFALFC
jgi:hypothetical protein